MQYNNNKTIRIRSIDSTLKVNNSEWLESCYYRYKF